MLFIVYHHLLWIKNISRYLFISSIDYNIFSISKLMWFVKPHFIGFILKQMDHEIMFHYWLWKWVFIKWNKILIKNDVSVSNVRKCSSLFNFLLKLFFCFSRQFLLVSYCAKFNRVWECGGVLVWGRRKISWKFSGKEIKWFH